MGITWKYVKPLREANAVKNFLEQHGVNLPARLIEIMENYNGGRPSEKAIITASQREYVFKSMLSYNRNDKETIYCVYPDLFKESSLFPIASDSAGNFICYDLKLKMYALYNHETDQCEAITNNIFEL